MRASTESHLNVSIWASNPYVCSQVACYKPLNKPDVTNPPTDANTKACKAKGYDYAGDTLIWFNLGKNLC